MRLGSDHVSYLHKDLGRAVQHRSHHSVYRGSGLRAYNTEAEHTLMATAGYLGSTSQVLAFDVPQNAASVRVVSG